MAEAPSADAGQRRRRGAGGGLQRGDRQEIPDRRGVLGGGGVSGRRLPRLRTVLAGVQPRPVVHSISAGCGRCTPRRRSSRSAARRCSARRSTWCSAPAGRGCSAARRCANFIFWGYQFFIVMAALSYVMGFSKSQEYAEPEWHLDLLLTVVWVAYAVVFIGTLMKRRRAAYLRRQLVLSGVHPDRSRCCTSATTSRCRCRCFSAKSYPRVRRRAERADPVVVWPQRGRLLPDRRRSSG